MTSVVFKEVDRPEGLDPDVALHVETCDELGLYLMARNVMDFMAREGRISMLVQKAVKEERGKKIKKRRGKKHRLEIKTEEDQPIDFSESHEALLSMRRLLHYIARNTTRFGVGEPLIEIPSQIVGMPAAIKPSQEYTSWYTWWHEWIQEDSEEGRDRWARINQDIEQGRDTSNWRPPGSWSGVVPVKWLTVQVEDPELAPIQYGFPKEHPRYAALRNYMKSDDQLWHYYDPESAEEGFAIVSNGRAVAKLKLEQLVAKEEQPDA